MRMRKHGFVLLGLAAIGCSSKSAIDDAGGAGGGWGVGGGGGVADAGITTIDGSAPDAGVGDSSVPPVDVGGNDVALPPGARALTANDVSVLFPLHGANSASVLWPPTLEGKGGPLLPVASYALIKRPLIFTGASLTPALEHDLLRVVAVRFDPCFGAAACQAQVRLVLQAVATDGRVFDGAVHLLYNLTQPEFAALLAELRALTALATENRAGLPLGPSPALLAQGGSGAYGTALRALVTRHAGAGNLARITFMTRTGARRGTWEFGGVNLKFFAPQGDLAISGLPPDTRLQTVTEELTGDYGYSVHPEPVRLQALLAVADAEKARSASPEARAAAYDALAKVENPTLETPDSADCASCHVANRLRGHLDQNYPPAVPPPSVYSGLAESVRLVGTAEKVTANLRAFGYFDVGNGANSPVISQRTANETHRVLQMLAAM